VENTVLDFESEIQYLDELKEKDPTGKGAHDMGAKLDVGKAPIFRGVLDYFPRALKAVSEVSLAGSKKYAWKSCLEVPNGFERYSDAMGRHVLAEATDGLYDDGPGGTGCLHAAQVAWNALIRLELLMIKLEKQVKPPSDSGTK
jgi:Domain of unknown function (DUF5664)